eukprot:405219_1
MVQYYEFALDLITDMDADEDVNPEEREIIESEADILYGYVHARFILTVRGLAKMRDKYMNREFGTCPRIACHEQMVLPCGIADERGKDFVKLYCPCCEENYNPPGTKYQHTDGAFFGTTFPHLFFMVYPELKPKKSTEKYVPKVFGFRVHESSHQKSLEARREAD